MSAKGPHVTKTCPVCQKTFERPVYTLKRGRSTYCSNTCRHIGHRVDPAKKREKVRKRNNKFMKNWRLNNLEIARRRNAEYREKNRALLTQKTLEYNREHPEVVHIRNIRRRSHTSKAPINDLSIKQWIEVKNAFNHCCAYCDKPSQKLTIDHITPVSRGGSHTLHNIVPACHSCNSKKAVGAPLTSVQPLLLTLAKPKIYKGRQT